MERRKFIKNSGLMGAGASLFMSSGAAWAFPPNETINVAILGTGGRSYAIAKAISLCENVKLTYGCDVDQDRLDSFLSYAQDNLDNKVKGEGDFRKILDRKDIDAIIITTPEHWHAPMSIMGMQAGKHVYVEKPCSHNLYENDLLVEAYKTYGKVCQMGNQQRSSVTSIKAIRDIRNGIIGDVYYGKAWYSNTRGPIGVGNKTPVPDYLNWDLWQGPAPREDYRDNVHPYNWHWFKTWGTGEIHNNGTHEIDICRWALDVKFPKRVVSTGGRLHFKNDDWEYYDTQNASFEFEDDKTITWEGKSCNGMNLYNRGRGAIIHGSSGSVLLDRDGYTLLDKKGNETSFQKEENLGTSSSTADTQGFDELTVKHLRNFFSAIRLGEELMAPIDDASASTHLCHLGNMAQELEVSLDVDTKTGKVLGNKKALSMWRREYQEGWEPKL